MNRTLQAVKHSNTPQPGGPRASQSGFTLIELMIAVAIVGILSAIAYPAYTDSVRKGKRAEARTALMNLLQQQERYMTQMNTYAEFSAGNPGTLPFKAISASEQAKSSHLLGARQCQAIGTQTPSIRECIEVFAEPQAGVFEDPQVTMLAIDTQGRRRCTGSLPERCWK